MVGDFGGGGMMLAFGMVSALLAVARGGAGQVIDAAMTDGTAVLMSMIHGMANQGLWREEVGANLLDTGAHFYDVYETADGKFVSIGVIAAHAGSKRREKDREQNAVAEMVVPAVRETSAASVT